MSKTTMAFRYGGLVRDEPGTTLFGQFGRIVSGPRFWEFVRWHYHWMLGEDAARVEQRRREHRRRNRKQRMR